MIVLYRSTLLSSDAGDFLPITQYMSFTFRSICFLFWAKCYAHVRDIKLVSQFSIHLPRVDLVRLADLWHYLCHISSSCLFHHNFYGIFSCYLPDTTLSLVSDVYVTDVIWPGVEAGSIP
jgi:hypothetical protein